VLYFHILDLFTTVCRTVDCTCYNRATACTIQPKCYPKFYDYRTHLYDRWWQL